jgi:hypothetical protein
LRLSTETEPFFSNASFLDWLHVASKQVYRYERVPEKISTSVLNNYSSIQQTNFAVYCLIGLHDISALRGCQKRSGQFYRCTFRYLLISAGHHIIFSKACCLKELEIIYYSTKCFRIHQCFPIILRAFFHKNSFTNDITWISSSSIHFSHYNVYTDFVHFLYLGDLLLYATESSPWKI